MNLLPLSVGKAAQSLTSPLLQLRAVVLISLTSWLLLVQALLLYKAQTTQLS